MMNKTIYLLLLVCFCMVSCLKEKREVTFNNQETKIDTYISNKMYVKQTVDGEEKTDTLRVVYHKGSSRLVLTEGTGEELKAGGTVSFYYAGYTFSSSKSYSSMFATNHQETATAAKWELTDADYALATIDMGKNELIEGLRNGLTGVRSGEHCEILFSGKYGFGQSQLGIIPENSAILFEIWVEGVSNE